MNKEWSLDKLYTGYDDPKFKEDENRLDKLIAEVIEFTEDIKGDPKENLVKTMRLMIELNKLANNLFIYPSLRQATNTSDEEATAIIGRMYQKMSALAAPRAKLTAYVASIDDLGTVIESDELLKEHEFFLNNVKENAKYTLSPEVEQVISMYEISGSAAWGDLQSYLTSTVPVEYNGKTTTLSDIRNKAYDPDPSVRKSAYEAELKSYDRIKDAVAFSLNSIKMEVISSCKLRGYESPLDETLRQNHMKREK